MAMTYAVFNPEDNTESCGHRHRTVRAASACQVSGFRGYTVCHSNGASLIHSDYVAAREEAEEYVATPNLGRGWYAISGSAMFSCPDDCVDCEEKTLF